MAVYSAIHGLLCVVILILVSIGTSESVPLKSSLIRFSPTRKWNRGAATVLASASVSAAKYDVRYYTQILDHFSFVPESYQTFQQKYLINSDHWGGASAKSPIFVYTGNEGFIEWFTENTGFMFDIAPQFKAMLVFIEHRFYGHSMPFGSQKAAYSNSSTLGFLSSAQALADFATLITDLKKNLSAEDSPVVVFGGSYGGISSSAPILYFDNITPIGSFDDTVSEDFRSESENCFKVIKGSWNVIDEMTSTPEGLKSLRKALRICKSNSDNYIAGNLAGWLYDAYYTAAMTDYPVAANFVQPLPAYPVKQMCKAIDNPSGSTDLLSQLYGVANVYYNYTGRSSCFDIRPSDPHGEDGWQFQACTEMVMPMADDPKKSMFPNSTFDYQERVDSCESAYGVQPRRHWITTQYGGHHIKRVLKNFASNIIFFNGLRDPWSGGGVLEDINESVVAIVAKEGAHHVDFRFATKDDPQWLKDARTKEISIIKSWLQQYYMELQNSSLI
uniref:Lysosomal Pro-X carboxypeptidase n=1 Tax=Picea sitchensis TaxID=3332 RepID=B8LPV2_PICSI|nr:unknown [Picea sitchensis]